MMSVFQFVCQKSTKCSLAPNCGKVILLCAKHCAEINMPSGVLDLTWKPLPSKKGEIQQTAMHKGFKRYMYWLILWVIFTCSSVLPHHDGGSSVTLGTPCLLPPADQFAPAHTCWNAAIVINYRGLLSAVVGSTFGILQQTCLNHN